MIIVSSRVMIISIYIGGRETFGFASIRVRDTNHIGSIARTSLSLSLSFVWHERGSRGA